MNNNLINVSAALNTHLQRVWGACVLTGLLACATAAHAQCPASFAPAVNYATAGGPSSVAVGDFNADGRADLAVANIFGNNVSVLLGNGNGTFAEALNYSTGGATPRSVAVGDFNGDGRADLAVANGSSDNVSVLVGNGNGTFAPAVNFAAGSGPFTVEIGDFNGDGRADLAVANLFGNNVSVLLGNGNGTFAAAVNFGAGASPTSVAVGDFNADGQADLAVANSGSGNVSVLLGNGLGSFAAATNFVTGASPRSVAIGDFNGDGRADLAVSNNNDGNVSVLPGNGNGTFAAAVNFGLGVGLNSVAVGDFNADGRADLAVANFGSNNVSVLRNTTAGNPLPVFTLQPVGRVVQVGASVSFSAAANFVQGAAPYQWRRNGIPLANGGNISGATTATLTISPVSAADSATYDVQATGDTCGTVLRTATSTAAALGVSTSNDSCSAAALIGNGTFFFSTVGATTDGPTENTVGFGLRDLQVNQDVWFAYTATCSGLVTVSLCGSTYDTKVAIYNGATCPTAPNTAIAGNDDSVICTVNTLHSYTTFAATAGNRYLIRVGGYLSNVGTVNMNIDCTSSPQCGPSDIAGPGQSIGPDGILTADDIIVFLNRFFSGCP
ncbi:FG-GAP-like repeat-containing protein [Synechococcus sp. Cruz CV-v-12]|uniref:FG-GAP-like repeat-containing protein n=1 Tax=Synechococcus sp. Cruz CV-v-12 TaxID=2823728 RepID=UPI0020CF9B7C|nr:FG-GAP-like repeat-containing protein [Synechococcus sp. Cruz CV-v-12]MCP9874377.1 VCBS repeat-containing protein [Synechococcus sp. Cruz CV-v-12]